MRRGVLAVLGTLTGATLLVGAKLGTHPPVDPNAVSLDAGAPASGGPPAGATQDAAGPSAGAPASSPGAGGPVAGSTAAKPGPGASRTAKPGGTRTTAPAAPPTTAAGTGLKSGQFKGAGAAAGQYGTVTVTIAVSGGRITTITQTYNAPSSTSQSISNGAFPTLRQEALSAQSAKIATVSGATYTSNAYKSSLQSAIDAAKA